MKKVLISLLLGVTLIGSLVGCDNTVSQEEYDTLQDSFSDTTKELVDTKIKEINEATETQKAEEEARNYLNLIGFSRKGLIELLIYLGYSTESAEYVVDNMGVDWNQQCARRAKEYLDFESFSREGLYKQLAYEGFTDEQIQYGLSHIGY